jgi:hypothetical protein
VVQHKQPSELVKPAVVKKLQAVAASLMHSDFSKLSYLGLLHGQVQGVQSELASLHAGGLQQPGWVKCTQ